MKKTVYCAVFFAFAAALVSLSVSTDSSNAAENSKFAIAYSGNIMGYFESCG